MDEMNFPPKQKLLEVPNRSAKDARSASPADRGVDSEDVDDLPESLSSRASSAEPSKQGAKQQLAELLDIWRSKRHSTEPLHEEERQRIERVLFETMPADRVSIVEIRRVVKPSLLRRFCEEERDSLLKQANQQKTHKQFMLLHGTRWDYAPLILENGLDPSCGHLTKGTWLGGIAEKAHSYAAKGPGPEVESEGPGSNSGNRLFTLFVVAAVPDISDGDDERSFGVWRVQSGRRLYTAYQVIYSAPMDLRRKAPLIVPRSNKAVLLRKQSYDKIETAPMLSSRTGRCRSASPPRRTTSPELPVALPLDLPAKPVPAPIKEPDAASSWPLDGMRLGGFRGACTSPALKVHQPGAEAPGRSVFRRTSAPKLLEATGPNVKGVTEHRSTPSPAPRSPSAQSPSPRPSRTSPAMKVRQPEEKPPPSPRTLNRPVDLGSQPAAKWEVLLDEGWVPFRPGSKFKDDAGTKVSICHGQFWYTLTFDANGTTGKQANQRTGKVRQLRRVVQLETGASISNEQTAITTEQNAPESEQKPEVAGGWFPSLLNSPSPGSPVKQAV
ncbi:unnamed protein product [Symbiodinium pilosum]|uniref:Poly [ADP-ribose] polymerase n=1 Tax=Symbiodinium pilosum TaxID=2952 RepID=A0A812IP48_SYMPI|nr:unnamed protein product [Symbiodinium pilosum]